MANTTLFNEPLPTVGGDTNAWGDMNNTLHAAWDALHGIPNRVKRAVGAIVSGACTLDIAVSTVWELTVVSDVTVDFGTAPSGAFASRLWVKLVNGAAHNVTWSDVTWLSDPPVFSSGVDLLLFFTNDNGASWYGLKLRSSLSSQEVNTVNIADAAVTTDQIADDAVTEAKLADGAVGHTEQIADAIITAAKLAPDVVIPTPISTRLAKTGSAQTLSGETDVIWSSSSVADEADLTMFSGGAPTLLIIPTAGDGIYLVCAQIAFGGTSGAGKRTIRIYYDGVEKARQDLYRQSGTDADILQVVAVVKTVATKAIRITAQSDQAQTVLAATTTWVSATRLIKL